MLAKVPRNSDAAYLFITFNDLSFRFSVVIKSSKINICIMQVKSGRYDTKDDFTVVLQPFMKAFNAPLEKSLRFKPFIDKSYITYDCFHFSQKGHALGKFENDSN